MWFRGTSVVQVVALTALGPGGQLFVVLESMFGHLTADNRGFPDGGTKVVHALYTILAMPTGNVEDAVSD